MLFAGSVFLIGALSAAVGGFSLGYLSTYAVYSGVIGIGWVSYWGAWADTQLSVIASKESNVAEAFVARSKARRQIEVAACRIRDARKSSVPALPLVLLAWVYVFARTCFSHRLPLFDQVGIRGGMQWSDASAWGLFWRNVVLDLYAVPIILLVLTMARGALLYVWLCLRLARRRLVFPLAGARARLRPLTRWGIYTGFAWMLALSTILLFFLPIFHHLARAKGATFVGALGRGDGYAWALLTIAVLAGAWPFALVMGPRIAFHRSLVRARDSFVREWITQVTAGRAPGAKRYAELLAGSPELQRRAELIEGGVGSLWVYSGPADLLLFAGQALLPLVSIGLSLLIRSG